MDICVYKCINEGRNKGGDYCVVDSWNIPI